MAPKLRYLTELAARGQRRTVSNYIECAIERALKDTMIEGREGAVWNVANEADLLWDVDEEERFVTLAQHYPELLTYDEQVRWKRMQQ